MPNHGFQHSKCVGMLAKHWFIRSQAVCGNRLLHWFNKFQSSLQQLSWGKGLCFSEKGQLERVHADNSRSRGSTGTDQKNRARSRVRPASKPPTQKLYKMKSTSFSRQSCLEVSPEADVLSRRRNLKNTRVRSYF